LDHMTPKNKDDDAKQEGGSKVSSKENDSKQKSETAVRWS